MTSPVLDITGVSFRWPGARGFTLQVPAFQVPRGGRVLLAGPSGTGKSTLLSLIAGVVRADAGTIRVLGQDLTRLRDGERDRFRSNHIGVIFQMFNLLPYARVLDNVILPLSFARDRRARIESAGLKPATEAARILTALGLEKGLHAGPASDLSIGQQQRVAAARALIGAPELIIAEEPTSALDASAQASLYQCGSAAASEASLGMGSNPLCNFGPKRILPASSP